MKLHGVMRLIDLYRCVQYLKDAIQRHSSRCHAGVQPHQILHRRKQPHVICHERDQRADRHHPVNDELPSIKENKRGAESEHRSGQRACKVRHHLHRKQRVDKALILLPESSDFRFLSVRSNDQPHAHQGLDQEAADVCAPLTHSLDVAGELRAIVL